MKFKKFDFVLESDDCFIKDFDFDKFTKKFPKILPLVEEMKSCISTDYRFYLVDLIIKNYQVGEKTCADVRYHVDGDFKKDNQYSIWLSGKNRTIFSNELIPCDNLSGDRDKQNNILEKILQNKPCFEIPEKTILIYDSLTPHKGVICSCSGKRTLVRVMGTNYIKPKNFIKFY